MAKGSKINKKNPQSTSFSKTYYDNNGYLIVEALASQERVDEYLLSEIRNLQYGEANKIVKVYRPRFVFDNALTNASATDKDVKLGHVTANTYNSSEAVGHIKAMKKDKLILCIKDQNTINRIVSKRLTEVSLGYNKPEIIQENGTFNGEPYDFKFNSPIVVNHVALSHDGGSRASTKIFDYRSVNNMKFKIVKNAQGQYELIGDDNVILATFLHKKQAEKHKKMLQAEAKAEEEEAEENEENEESEETTEVEEELEEPVEQNTKPASQPTAKAGETTTPTKPTTKATTKPQAGAEAPTTKPATTPTTKADETLEQPQTVGDFNYTQTANNGYTSNHIRLGERAVRLGIFDKLSNALNRSENALANDINTVIHIKKQTSPKQEAIGDNRSTVANFLGNYDTADIVRSSELCTAKYIGYFKDWDQKQIGDLRAEATKVKGPFDKDVFGKKWWQYDHLLAVFADGKIGDYNIQYQALNNDNYQDILNNPTYKKNRTLFAQGFGNGAIGDSLDLVNSALTAVSVAVAEAWHRTSKIDQIISAEATKVNEGAKFYESRIYDVHGEWKDIDDAGTEANTTGNTNGSMVVPLHYSGLNIRVTDEEVRSAIMAGVPLVQRSLDRAGTFYNLYLEKKLLFNGIFQHKEIPVENAAAVWSASDVAGQQAILKIIFDTMSKANTRTEDLLTSEIFWAGTGGVRNYNIILDDSKFDLLSNSTYNIPNGSPTSITLMDWIKEKNPLTTRNPNVRVNFIPFNKMEGIGASKKDRIFMGFNNTEVAAYGYAITPRVLPSIREQRGMIMPLEAKQTDIIMKHAKAFAMIDIPIT